MSHNKIDVHAISLSEQKKCYLLFDVLYILIAHNRFHGINFVHRNENN